MVCKKKEQLIYLHIFHYNGESLSPQSEMDEWVGKVRVLVDKLDTLKID